MTARNVATRCPECGHQAHLARRMDLDAVDAGELQVIAVHNTAGIARLDVVARGVSGG